MSKPNSTPPALTFHQILTFWANVNRTPGQGPNGDCWEWKGNCPNGYGQFTPIRRGRNYRANRLAFYLTHSRWPNTFSLHKCDNPACCRPEHLFEGNSRDNIIDAQQKGRLAFGDRNGMRQHPEKVTRGSKHKLAKLTEQDVLAIRHIGQTTQLLHREIAKQYKISRSLVSLIIKRKTWRHI